MKTYKVTVNGTAYEITLEAIDTAEVKAAPATASAPAAAPAPVATAPVSCGETVKAPMPGNILAVNVTNGAAIKKGDVICVLEAMKMENDIVAPCDGTVSSVSVTKGATVETGTVICVIS